MSPSLMPAATLRCSNKIVAGVPMGRLALFRRENHAPLVPVKPSGAKRVAHMRMNLESPVGQVLRLERLAITSRRAAHSVLVNKATPYSHIPARKVSLMETCTFIGCTLIYTGTDTLGLEGCTMNNCRWSFEGPAGNTLEFMRAIYHHLGTAGRQIVETTFENIRRLPDSSQ